MAIKHTGQERKGNRQPFPPFWGLADILHKSNLSIYSQIAGSWASESAMLFADLPDKGLI